MAYNNFLYGCEWMKLKDPNHPVYKYRYPFSGTAFIASGGVSSIGDLQELERMGCRRVIVGKAIYENRILEN